MPAIMSLDDRVLHLSLDGREAVCGETVRHPWISGSMPSVADKATDMCFACFDRGHG